MRVLLDEQLDVRLKNDFSADVDVWTVAERGWKGKKNGELLRAAQQEFDVLITMDKGIEHQQNWKAMSLSFIQDLRKMSFRRGQFRGEILLFSSSCVSPIIIVSAKTNRYVDIAPLMPLLNERLRQIQVGQLIHIP